MGSSSNDDNKSDVADNGSSSNIDVPSTHSKHRTYKYITIPIGKEDGQVLRVTLISDTVIDTKCSAAMVVQNCGQLHDSVHTQGIAHLTEHMVFMGSTKFPVENEYDEYIQKHAGSSNAYTDLERTVYYFDIINNNNSNSNNDNDNNEDTTDGNNEDATDAKTTTNASEKSDADSLSVFENALQRFLSCIFTPLFTTSSITKEINAVDSEHTKNITQDMWRSHQLSRCLWGNTIAANTAQQQHSYGYFGTGNQASLNALGDSEMLRTNIQAFYKQNYTVANMTLCIMSSQSIGELQSMITGLLETTIPTFETTPPSPTIPPSLPPRTSAATTTLVQWIPIRENYTVLEFQWHLTTSQYTKYTTKPGMTVSHVLGHEGPGTLLYVLRKHGYVNELYVDDGSSTSCTNFTIFTLNMELTPQGLKHVHVVVAAVRYYIHTTLSAAGTLPDWVRDELKVTGSTTFHFLPCSNDISTTTSSVAIGMHKYSRPEHCLSGAYKLFDNESADADIQQILTDLQQTNNLIIFLGSSSFSTTESDGGMKFDTEQYYGTKYRIVTDADDSISKQIWEAFTSSSVNDDTIQTVVKDLSLPEPNTMLPTNFDLVTTKVPSDIATTWFGTATAMGGIFGQRHSTPKLIQNDTKCRLWYKPDCHFDAPKVNVLTVLRTPVLDGSLEQSVLGEFVGDIVTELVNDYAYYASMAGLHCGVSSSSRGIEIQISGYNDKAHVLLARVCTTIQQDLPAKLTQAQSAAASTASENDDKASDDDAISFFERIRNKLEQQYQSMLVAQPYEHGGMAADLVLDSTNSGMIEDRIAYLTNIVTPQSVLVFAQQAFRYFSLEALVHGNVTADEAKTFAQIVLDTFQPVLPVRFGTVRRGVVLPAASSTSKECSYRRKNWNEHDENSCVVNIYQIGLVSIRENAILAVLLQILREPAFNTLRTEEQLGYIVFSSAKTNADNVKSIMILVQSESHDPVHVDSRIETFLDVFRSTVLMALTDEDLATTLHAVCESLLVRNRNLSEESSKLWSAISSQTYLFDRLALIAADVKELRAMDIVRFFDRYVAAESPFRRKLSVQLYGTAHTEQYRSFNNATSSSTGADSTGEKENPVLVITNPDDFVRQQDLYAAVTIPPTTEHLFDC